LPACDYCGVPIVGFRCANMHCNQSQKPKLLTPAPARRKTTPLRKKTSGPQPQDDGSYLIPSNIHLEKEDSLPKHFGYKTDKKSTEEGRHSTLLLLYESTFVVYPGARNRSAIAEFGPPSSDKRKWKLLSWMDGRIARSQRPALKTSLDKLLTDRTFIVEKIQ